MTAVAVSTVALVVIAVSDPVGKSTGSGLEKIRDVLPEGVKRWLEEFISSRRKLTVDKKTGSPFLPTKSEVLAYGVSLVVIAASFSYVKVDDVTQILQVLPTVLATAVIVEFVKTYVLEVFARSRGLWTEHRLWYFGLAIFLLTTFTFGIPFSSPSCNVYPTTKTKNA